MIDEELIQKYCDHNIFIGDIIRAPKIKKVSKGKLYYIQRLILYYYYLTKTHSQLRIDDFYWILLKTGRKESLLYEEGLLNGFHIVVKDNINVRGFNTSAGTKALKDYKPEDDALVVQKLKAAGAIIIGI